MRHNKDILWKGVLEWVFEDLLRFVYPQADQLFDFKKGFDFMDKELAELYPELEKGTDVRVVDKLVKVFRRDGMEEWVLVHIEVQDRTNAKDRPYFPERMFRYFYRCYDRYKKPVAAIAIFCGPDGRQLPRSYAYELMNTRLQYEYNTVCILDYSDEELRESQNPFAWVVLTAKNALLRGKDIDKKLLEGNLFIFRKLYENGIFQRRKLQAVFTFLKNYIKFESRETNRIFSKEIDKITEKENTMDIFEAAAQMKVEDKVEEIVENLLNETSFSVEKIAGIANVSVEFVKDVKKHLKKR
jgi:hypothetical protein